jgi:hypothetical protein
MRQSAARHGDHHGVVPGKQDVDPDYLEQGDPEGRLADFGPSAAYGVYPAAWMQPLSD